MLIKTRQKSVPWRWVTLIVTPWFGITFVEMMSGVILTLTLKIFIDHPGLIMSISSINTLFNILIAAAFLYISDHVWTRYGRRLPFIAAAYIPMILLFLFMPFIPNFWLLLIAVIVWQAVHDIGYAYEPLQQEIVPPHQRGRGGGIFYVSVQLVVMFYYTLVIGRFYEVSYGPVTINGMQAAYWLGALFLFSMLLFFTGFVKELKPLETKSDRPTPAGFIKAVFTQKHLWPVYSLAFAQMLFQVGLGAFMPLLFKQWGYSPQEMGTNIAVGGLINIFIVAPIVGAIADRVDRLKIYIFGVTMAVIMKLVYIFFIQVYLPAPHIPTLGQVILLGEMIAVFGLMSGIVLQPLMFDYIPRDEMGTATAGIYAVKSLTKFLTLNGVGWWVVLYARIFLADGEYDYFCSYYFLFIMGLIGLAFIFNFRRLVKKGVLVKHGWEGIEE